MSDHLQRLERRLERIEQKVDELRRPITVRSDKQKYMSARQVGRYTGLNHRTILNRSNLDPSDPRYIPSVRLGSRRKYFDRRVIERLFRPI